MNFFVVTVNIVHVLKLIELLELDDVTHSSIQLFLARVSSTNGPWKGFLYGSLETCDVDAFGMKFSRSKCLCGIYPIWLVYTCCSTCR